MIKIRAAFRRWIWLVILGTLLAAVIGGISVALQPEQDPSYQATSVILFDLDRSSTAAQQAAQQAGLRVKRGEVPLRAAEILETTDAAGLLDGVDVEVDGESLSLIIRATDPNSETAVAVAEAFTTAFLETSNQQELDALDAQIELLERQVQAAQARLAAFDQANPLISALTDTRIPLVQERSNLLAEVADLTQQLDETRQQRETTSGPYSRLGEPTVAVASVGMLALPTKPLIRVLLLTGLGFALSVLVVGMLERFNPRIDTKEEAQETMQLPVLAMVPHLGRRARRRIDRVTPEHFGGGHAESYRRLRSAIQFVSGQASANADDTNPPRSRSFLIVSASPGEGKTSTVAFTSFALAEADVPTLAINADCRRPTLHERLGVNPDPGLTDLAEYQLDRPGVDDVAQAGPIEDLWVVSSGHPGPLTTEMVHAVHDVTEVAIERGATVVIDSSPLLATADAMELVPLVDHVIFVIRNGRTTRKEALEGLEMLRLRDAPLLGCVCIGSPESKRRYSYYENYYFHSTSEAPAPATQPFATPTVDSTTAPRPIADSAGPGGPVIADEVAHQLPAEPPPPRTPAPDPPEPIEPSAPEPEPAPPTPAPPAEPQPPAAPLPTAPPQAPVAAAASAAAPPADPVVVPLPPNDQPANPFRNDKKRGRRGRSNDGAPERHPDAPPPYSPPVGQGPAPTD